MKHSHSPYSEELKIKIITLLNNTIDNKKGIGNYFRFSYKDTKNEIYRITSFLPPHFNLM